MAFAEKISNHILKNYINIGLLLAVSESHDIDLNGSVSLIKEKVLENVKARIEADSWLDSFNQIKIEGDLADKVYDVVAFEYENGYEAGFADAVKLINFAMTKKD